VGFEFERNTNEIELVDYKKEILTSAVTALETHIKNMGGEVDNPNKFDPYKSSISSITGNKLPA
jgi:hypothetical protein